MKDFSFRVFYNETELIQKFSHYIIATKKMRVRNVNQFVLKNEETIIHEINDRNRNVKIFKTFF